MNRLQLAWKALNGSLNLPDAPPTPANRQLITVVNGNIIGTSDNKQAYLTEGFNINDIIYSIVQLVVEKVRIAPWGVYKIVDEQSLKRYQSIMSKKTLSGEDFLMARDLRHKALEPFKDDYLTNLLDNPNPYCGFQDIVADSSMFKMLMGSRMIEGGVLSGGANKGKPTQLNILPSQEVSLVVSKKWPFEILGYKITSWNMSFTPEEVLQDNYFDPNFNINGQHLFGLAPMKAALRLTDRSNSENRAATSAYHNGGPRTIIFVDDDKYEAEQKGAQAGAIKEILTNGYTGPDNSNKMAASGYKMGVVPVGLSPVDLDIIKSEQWSLRRFCNIWGVPAQLMNDTEGSTFNNVQEAEKALTTRAALPMLNSFREAFNRKLRTVWGYKGTRIFADYDMNVYSELQENMTNKWGWVKDLPTTNMRKLELMGEDAPEGHDEFMGKILIPSNYSTSEDYEQNETDRALAQGDEEISQDPQGAKV